MLKLRKCNFINKVILVFGLFVIIACDTTESSNEENVNVRILRPSFKMSFTDYDSLYKQAFYSLSEFDGEVLKWTIDIFESGLKMHTIEDSTYGKSYLVKAADLNGDSIAELVFVTADFYAKDSMNQILKPSIFIYCRKNTTWEKINIPDLEKQIGNGIYEGQVVEVKDGEIIHRFRNNEKSSVCSEDRLIRYNLSSSDSLVVTIGK
ncbi:MAG: hypothetical protein ACK40G_09245 [Cytophagaceae bacterium]